MKRSILYTVLLAAAISMFAACSKDEKESVVTESNVAYLTVKNSNMDILEGAATRADVRVGSSLGLALYKEGRDFVEPYIPYYHFVMGSTSYGEASTSHYFNLWNGKAYTGGNTLSHIPVFTDRGKITIYGWAPAVPSRGWTSEERDQIYLNKDYVHKVMFRFEDNVHYERMYDNYLYMKPITIDPAIPEERDLDLQFYPAFARIRLQMRKTFNSSPMTIHYIVVETADGNEWLYYSGYYDATTGDLTAIDEAVMTSRYRLWGHNRTTGLELTTAYSDIAYNYMTMPPIEMTADDTRERKLKVSFYVGKENGFENNVPVLGGSFIIDIGKLKNDKGEYGIRRGYNYDYKITFDNYLKFNVMEPEIREWNDENIDMVI